MLGLYLYTLIIGHKSCNMLNELPLQKELPNFGTNNVFVWTKSKITSTTKQKIKHKLHPKRMRDYCATESTETIYCSQTF